MKKLTTYIVILFISTNALAISRKDQGKIAVLASDILFNGIRAGIGAENFWPAFVKGALGGAAIFGTKLAVASTDKYPGIALLVQPIHAGVVSYVDSVQFDTAYVYRTQLGPLWLEYGAEGLHAEIGIIGLGALTAGVIKSMSEDDFHFDVENSILNLTPVFSGAFTTRGASAYSGGVVFVDPRGSSTNLSHEMMHHLHRRELAFTDDLIDNYFETPLYKDLADIFFVGPDVTASVMLGAGYVFGIYEELPLEWQAFEMER